MAKCVVDDGPVLEVIVLCVECEKIGDCIWQSVAIKFICLEQCFSNIKNMYKYCTLPLFFQTHRPILRKTILKLRNSQLKPKLQETGNTFAKLARHSVWHVRPWAIQFQKLFGLKTGTNSAQVQIIFMLENLRWIWLFSIPLMQDSTHACKCFYTYTIG